MNDYRLISSTLTFGYKRIFPAFWFGGLAIVTIAAIFGLVNRKVSAEPLLIILAMWIFGYIVMRFMVFSLVDEVWIENSEIIVRNRGWESRFPIANISTVRSIWFANPEQIMLTLREPCHVGSKVVFCPKVRLLKLSPHPIAKELRELMKASPGITTLPS